MRHDFIKFLTTFEDYIRSIKTLEGKTFLPNVIRAIDGTLLKIR